jgi:hypothetical protein
MWPLHDWAWHIRCSGRWLHTNKQIDYTITIKNKRIYQKFVEKLTFFTATIPRRALKQNNPKQLVFSQSTLYMCKV